jgi:hypothetical protein
MSEKGGQSFNLVSETFGHIVWALFLLPDKVCVTRNLAENCQMELEHSLLDAVQMVFVFRSQVMIRGFQLINEKSSLVK